MMALRAVGGRPHNYSIIRYIIMALELQNDLQQKIQSDNLSIASSNRLARGNLATAEQIQNVQQEAGEGEDGFGTGKALYGVYGMAKDISKAGGAEVYGAAEFGKFKSAASYAASTATNTIYTAVRPTGFTPGPVGSSTPGLTPEGRAMPTGAARTAQPAGATVTNDGQDAVEDYAAVPTEPATEARPDPRLDDLAADGKAGASEMMARGGKALGALGGVYAVEQDITHHGFYGNAWDKASNVLTIASSVADFVPGLEAVGLVGTAAAAVTQFIGDHEDDNTDSAKDSSLRANTDAPTESAAKVTVSQGSAPDASRGSAMPASNTF